MCGSTPFQIISLLWVTRITLMTNLKSSGRQTSIWLPRTSCVFTLLYGLQCLWLLIFLCQHLAVHGWITFNGQKMSKSLGNVVDPFVLGERYGADAIRYHILREMALGADSSFSNEIMINRINSDLANGFGNLVSRTVAMVIKYFDGTLPAEKPQVSLTG